MDRIHLITAATLFVDVARALWQTVSLAIIQEEIVCDVALLPQ